MSSPQLPLKLQLVFMAHYHLYSPFHVSLTFDQTSDRASCSAVVTGVGTLLRDLIPYGQLHHHFIITSYFQMM